jgi:hypothetical protein
MSADSDQQVADLQRGLHTAVDALQVTAILESHGITDHLARERFWAGDVFEMGERLYAQVSEQADQLEDQPAPTGWVPPGSTELVSGGVKIAGTLILVAVIVALRVSPFWLSDQLVTLAVGLGAGLIVSGGISPVFVRRLLFCHERAGPASAFRWFQATLPKAVLAAAGLSLLCAPVLALFANYFFPAAADLRLAMLTLAAVTAAAAMGRLLLPTYGGLVAFLAATALVGCSWAGGSVVFECYVILVLSTVFWLLVNTLYFLKQPLWFPFATAAGLSVYLTMRQLFRVARTAVHLNLSVAVVLVWGTAIVIMLVGIERAFRTRLGPEPKAALVRSRAPRLATARLYAGYLVFGTLYSALIVSDHFLAWSGYSAQGLTLIERISVYESTIFLVLLPFVLPFQLTEQVIRRFWEGVIKEARPDLVQRTRELYGWGLRRALALLVLCNLVTFSLVAVVARLGLLEAQFPALASTVSLLPVAMVAHILLLWGGLNGFFLVSLSRLDAALRCLVPAVVVEVLVGLLVTQWVDFRAAVVALAAGTALFALLSYRMVRQTIADVGYYYYRCLLTC